MRRLTPIAALLALGMSLPALSQTAQSPAAPASKPPSTVPEGGRGLPADNPGEVKTVPSGGRGMNDVNGAGASSMIDVNSADQASLQSSLGLKETDAKAVVKYRDKHGPLTSQTQLSSIGGLSREGAEKMKGRVQFGSSSQDAMPAASSPK